jgi:hypothetical protein
LLTLGIPPSELDGLGEFDIHVRLLSGSGVEQQDKACATLRGLRVVAR